MDGCKIIREIVFAGIIMLAITSCTVQNPGYVGLYVANVPPVDEAIEPGETPLEILKTNDELNQLLQSRRDTIKLLRSQLQNLQLQPPKTDTVIIENVVKKVKSEKEIVAGQKSQSLVPALQDTIRLLKTRLLSLEKQTAKDKDIPDPAKQDKKDVAYEMIADTTMLLHAFYEAEEIKPLEEESILKQIKELIRNKDVSKISISYYAGSSGEEIVNKEIASMRLNYLSEKIVLWIPKEKISIQNFGDISATDLVVSDKHRIEIRIHTQ